MADHGKNYERMMGRTEDDQVVEVGVLSPECGHHCGVIMTGLVQKKAHCNCPECHNPEPNTV